MHPRLYGKSGATGVPRPRTPGTTLSDPIGPARPPAANSALPGRAWRADGEFAEPLAAVPEPKRLEAGEAGEADRSTERALRVWESEGGATAPAG